MSKRNTDRKPSKKSKTSFAEFAEQFDKNHYYTPNDVGGLNLVRVAFTRTDGKPDNDGDSIIAALKAAGLRPAGAVKTAGYDQEKKPQAQLAVFLRAPKVRDGREHAAAYEWRMCKWYDKLGRALVKLRCPEATISGAGL